MIYFSSTLVQYNHYYKNEFILVKLDTFQLIQKNAQLDQYPNPLISSYLSKYNTRLPNYGCWFTLQTGTGFIKVDDTNGFNLVPESEFEHHASCKGNPATNEWTPAPADTVKLHKSWLANELKSIEILMNFLFQASFVSNKPPRSDNWNGLIVADVMKYLLQVETIFVIALSV